MFFQYGTNVPVKPSEEEESQYWAQQLQMYLAPYSERLDAYLDRRVVGNLTASVAGIVQMRSALTTSELGSAICGPEHAEAGTRAIATRVASSGMGVKSDRRGAVGTSRGESPADAASRRNAVMYLG